MINTIRTTAEVQADIDALLSSIDAIGDQIFTAEQVSTDYRAMLSDPTSGTSNLSNLAVLRERRRALEIALEAARKDLKGAELNELREDTLKRRNELKVLLAERERVSKVAHDLLATAVHAVLNVRSVDLDIVKTANMNADNPLTPNGYLVLDGLNVLGNPDLMKEWATKTVDIGLKSGGRSTWDFSGKVREVGGNILRQWDIANSTGKLKIIDHDPLEAAEGHTPDPKVEEFDPDPTEDDLAGIAGLPPEKAAKAMNAFANSRWGRANGLGQPTDAAKA